MNEDKFSCAHAFTAKWEGGISDHPADRGGFTAYGVSTEFMRELMASAPSRRFLATLGLSGNPDRALMKKISREKAAAIFRYYFWDAQNLDLFCLPVATVWYDMAVNHGRAGACRIIQQAANNVLRATLKVDGIPGPQTCGAVQKGGMSLASEAIRIRRQYFNNIVNRRPSQKVFLKGWLNRANALEKYVTGLPL